MTHRPLQKVERSPNLMITTIVLNLIIFIIEVLFQVHYSTNDPDSKQDSFS